MASVRLSSLGRLAWSALVALALGLAASSGCGSPPIPPASASQRARVRVTLYSTRWCPACASARQWLARRGIPFHERDVEQSRDASARLARLNPSRSVPTLEIEGQVVVGFVAEELRAAIDTAAHRYQP